MLSFAVLLVAAQVPVASDLGLARDAFAGLCGDLSSETVIAAAATAKGWVATAPDPKRQVGIYYAAASSWGEWKGAVFHTYRKVVAGHITDGIVFDVTNSKATGVGLHCAMYMDDARVANLGDVMRWGTTEPAGIGIAKPDPAAARFLQWRDPGVFVSHDITTIALPPAGRPGIEIWAINAPAGMND